MVAITRTVIRSTRACSSAGDNGNRTSLRRIARVGERCLSILREWFRDRGRLHRFTPALTGGHDRRIRGRVELAAIATAIATLTGSLGRTLHGVAKASFGPLFGPGRTKELSCTEN
jgi:hypothetical protein